MKRGLLVLLPVGLGITWWALRADPKPVKPPTQTEPQRSLRMTQPQPRAVLEPSAPAPVAPERPAELVHAVELVQAQCGLPLALHCEGSDCVVVATGPDLDGLQGWLQLVWTSPGFVGSVVARDLGVRSLPCAEAIRGLDVGDVRIVESPGGAEVWCAGRGAGHRALCERVLGVKGFTGDTRVLRF